MSALGGGAPLTRKRSAEVSSVGVLILVRVAADGGATRAEVAADLAPLFTHKLSPQEWRRLAEKEIGQLVATNHVVEAGNRLSRTLQARPPRLASSARRALPDVSWSELRDLLLVAKGLGLEKEGHCAPEAACAPRGAARADRAEGLWPAAEEEPAARQASRRS